MNEDNFGVQIDANVVDKDIDEVNLENMTDDEIDKYIEDNYGYIDHPEIK